MISFIQLSESDKRVLIGVLLIFIIVLILVWWIGYLIARLMKYSGKKIDNHVSDVVTNFVITDPKHFRKYAHKKNWRIFFKRAKIPVLIILVGSAVLLVKEIIDGFTYNPFNKETGFASLLFLWESIPEDSYTEVWFLPFKVLKQLPPPTHTPTFVPEAWAGYIFVTCLIVGGIWYLIDVSGLIARGIRIRKLSDTIFSKDLDNFNQNNVSTTNPSVAANSMDQEKTNQ